jgi:hypothetical protein
MQVHGTHGTHAEYIGFLTLLFRTSQQKISVPELRSSAFSRHGKPPFRADDTKDFQHEHDRRGIARRNPSLCTYRSETEALWPPTYRRPPWR